MSPGSYTCRHGRIGVDCWECHPRLSDPARYRPVRVKGFTADASKLWVGMRLDEAPNYKVVSVSVRELWPGWWEFEVEAHFHPVSDT